MVLFNQSSIFMWDREAPAGFVAALAEAIPQDDNLTRFLPVWEPGEPQEPIQRWTLWQMRSPAVTAQMIARNHPCTAGLQEEHPRRYARWDANAGSYRKPGGGLAKTDRLTWELYQRTGMYGQRWWIVQGPNGGHRWALNATEKRILRDGSHGKVLDVPMPGDLPYADPDHRTIQHLLELQQVTLWHRICRYAEDHEARLDAAQREQVEIARGKFFDWMTGQLDGIYGESLPLYKRALADLPHEVGAKPSPPNDLAALRADFVGDH